MQNLGNSSMSFEKSYPREGNERVAAGQRHLSTWGKVHPVSRTQVVYYHAINVLFILSLLSEGEFR
jgi:hypothetical protein